MRHGSDSDSNRGANGGRCRLPAGRTYRAHQGARQRRRALERNWRAIEQLAAHDRDTAAARDALAEHVATTKPEASADLLELVALQLALLATLRAQERGTTWAAEVRRGIAEDEAATRSAGPALAPVGHVEARA